MRIVLVGLSLLEGEGLVWYEAQCACTRKGNALNLFYLIWKWMSPYNIGSVKLNWFSPVQISNTKGCKRIFMTINGSNVLFYGWCHWWQLWQRSEKKFALKLVCVLSVDCQSKRDFSQIQVCVAEIIFFFLAEICYWWAGKGWERTDWSQG